MHTVIEAPINAISTNKDASQVVVAGRNVFRVFSIEDDAFVERCNLRVGKNLNLNFSAADVTWNPVEDHLLASAATNGAVVTWNLNKPSRSKQELVFNEHKRTVNRVCFHSTEANLLLSGSQDGFMKLFDLRKKEVNCTFSGQSESVRDVQFCPHHYFQFAAAYENGNLQLWDLRRPDKWEKMFTAHSGPAFTLDWHPDDKNWIASAGRDRSIKIWEISHKPRLLHTVQTIASVARVKWRPSRKYHISSCSLLVDHNVNVWDIRRPYIPFASFEEHRDVVTGIMWKNDPYVFLSGSKDCTVYQHMFKDAVRPADRANPIGIDTNVNGDLGLAFSDKLLVAGKSQTGSSMLPHFFRSKGPDRSEQFTMASSSAVIFESVDKSTGLEWFIECATRYQLSGKSVEDLCDHNAAVAGSLNKHQVAQTWRILKLLYGGNTATPCPPRTVSVIGSPAVGEAHKAESEKVNLKQQLDGHLVQDHNRSTHTDGENKDTGDTSTAVSEDESDAESSLSLTNIASGQVNQQGDFFFGDGELETFDYPVTMANMDSMQDWTLPTEAIPLRHEIQDRLDSPDPLQNATDSPSSANESEFSSQAFGNAENATPMYNLQAIPFASQNPPWEFSHLVCDMLEYFAEQGDVQTSVSVLIILGNKMKTPVEDQKQEQWFMAYLELLTRFRLWGIANEVIKLSSHRAVASLNQQSTTVHTNCNKCFKPLTRAGWLCDRCKALTSTCSICHLPVKGLFAWCQGCSHGGHLEHLREWLMTHKHCPTGCGHICEYT
ncbi:GATOR complex protein WDR24 [Lingula anatina]|uniref:GATOR2 complex protein WDR24 n=1 Tax=Lingula anatina TaxID=7574 RepID=A0A1S3I190_LINAN|nr:GATOR complex protein WDR24 [Lingula anatina]|eukprot:XP_013392028.1 GATOR complex protein WDR24 [Lingula anatina]